MATTKLDLTREYKTYYTAKTTSEVVEFNEAQFLTIEGKGAPGGKEFTSKVEALYPLAYGVERVYWTTFVEWYNYNNKGVNGFFDNVGLIRNSKFGEGEYKKLSYYTFRELVQKLDSV